MEISSPAASLNAGTTTEIVGRHDRRTDSGVTSSISTPLTIGWYKRRQDGPEVLRFG